MPDRKVVDMTQSPEAPSNPSARNDAGPHDHDVATTEVPGTRVTVSDIVDEAKKSIDGNEYVSVSSCVDWLLDCHNAADRPAVKNTVRELIPQFSVGNLRTSASFREALDQIQMAVELDTALND